MEKTQEMIDRFWPKVDVRGPDECWPWTARKTQQGYGDFWVSKAKQHYRAHRFAYELLVGEIPKHLPDLDHTCHNGEDCDLNELCPHRACCNPNHLEPVTHRENIRRGQAPAGKLSRQTHCKRGHEFDEENTRWTTDGMGRACKACHRDEVRVQHRIDNGIPLDAPVGAPRFKTHCKWGHEFTPENRYEGKGCRKCTKIRNDAKPRKGGHSQRPRPTHCKHGHEMTEENTYVQPTSGSRACNICRRARTALSNARKAEARKALKAKKEEEPVEQGLSELRI